MKLMKMTILRENSERNWMVKSIILLSGGLDSVVSLGLCREKYNVQLALTFDYGQKSFEFEESASSDVCKYYDLRQNTIKLDFLKDITHTSLVSGEEIPTGARLFDSKESAQSVWVPNRNGLFLNIAASYADGEDYDYIIIGANKEEGETFPDNTLEFIERTNAEFEYSTRKHPKVIAPLIKSNKNDIVKLAIENNVPLELIRSCYSGGTKHCGVCESCVRLKKALEYNNKFELIDKLFL